MTQKILFVSLHPIDISQKDAQSISFKDKEPMVHAYVEDLFNVLIEEETNREFKFRGKTTEVCGAVAKLAASHYDKSPQVIADRLLVSEKKAQSKYKNITKLSKGSLVQAHLERGGIKYIIFTKLDHHSFLDEHDLTKRVGLPYEKRVLKACLIPLDSKNDFSEVKVFDTNAKIAEYWWSDFLELEEERSDEANTRTAFDAVDGLLLRNVAKESKRDYHILRNAVIFYFKNHPTIKYGEMINDILGNYTPSNTSIDADKIRAKAIKLPADKKFDSQFNVEKSAIKARSKFVIQLRENLELHLKAEVKDLAAVVVPFNENGIKGIKITTEEGWKEFQ